MLLAKSQSDETLSFIGAGPSRRGFRQFMPILSYESIDPADVHTRAHFFHHLKGLWLYKLCTQSFS